MVSKALEPLLQSHHKNALILGGGASRRCFALDELGVMHSSLKRDQENAKLQAY
jgi:shikimate dehydrogenase